MPHTYSTPREQSSTLLPLEWQWRFVLTPIILTEHPADPPDHGPSSALAVEPYNSSCDGRRAVSMPLLCFAFGDPQHLSVVNARSLYSNP